MLFLQVVASAYAQYFVYAYILFAIFCVMSSNFIYSYLAPTYETIFESVLVLFLGSIFDRISHNLIFVGGKMVNPVLWTWYSTYYLVFNLVTGVIKGISRMIYMIIWIVIQVGIIDRSNFPEGKENNDPAFVSFFQTLNFHHRCIQFPIDITDLSPNHVNQIFCTGTLKNF